MVRDDKSVGEMLMNSFTKTTTVLPRFGYIKKLQSASNIASRLRLRSSRNYCSYECNPCVLTQYSLTFFVKSAELWFYGIRL